MQSRAKTVTEYMKEVPIAHLDVLTELREICVSNLPGFRESMVFGVPSYLYNEEVEVSWQSQKNEVVLMIRDEQTLQEFKSLLKGMDVVKNNIYFKKLDSIDFSLLAQLIQQVAAAHNRILI